MNGGVMLLQAAAEPECCNIQHVMVQKQIPPAAQGALAVAPDRQHARQQRALQQAQRRPERIAAVRRARHSRVGAGCGWEP